MPMPRKSLEAARLSGALAKNPQRYRARGEPIVDDPLGPPPDWLTSPQAEAWHEFDDGLPWLNRSHRGIVGIAAILEAKMRDEALGVPGMQLLKACLGMMCATPATANKVCVPLAESDDPGDEFFR